MTGLWIKVGAVLLVALAGWQLRSHWIGVGEDRREVVWQEREAARLAEERRVEDARRQASQEVARELEAVRADRDAAYAAARARIEPVIVRTARCPAVPTTTDPASTADGAATTDELPVSPERDIGPALLVLAEQCQRAHDVAVGWQRWWASVSAVR